MSHLLLMLSREKERLQFGLRTLFLFVLLCSLISYAIVSVLQAQRREYNHGFVSGIEFSVYEAEGGLFARLHCIPKPVYDAGFSYGHQLIWNEIHTNPERYCEKTRQPIVRFLKRCPEIDGRMFKEITRRWDWKLRLEDVRR